MSRHRNVRSMNYEEDFYEDEDYLGHSVEDNYCISPGTAAQFTFNRDKNVDLAHYMEEGIPEEDEEDSDTDQHSLNNSAGTPRLQLNETDQAKLNSCLDEVRNVIGDSCPEHIMSQAIVRNSYNIQPTLNELLNQQDAPKPQRQPRESRRNRLQGDDDDFDEFLQSLDSESPNDKTLLLSNNLKHSLGIMKYGGSWSSESSIENLRNSGLKCGNSKSVNYSSAGSSECLSSTPDVHETTYISKREKYPSTGSSDCLSSTPEDTVPMFSVTTTKQSEKDPNPTKSVNNSLSCKQFNKQNCSQPINQKSSNKQPSLSQLAFEDSVSNKQPSLSQLANRYSSTKHQHSLLQATSHNIALDTSLKEQAIPSSTQQQSLGDLENKLSNIGINHPSSRQQLTKEHTSDTRQPSLVTTSKHPVDEKHASLSALACQQSVVFKNSNSSGGKANTRTSDAPKQPSLAELAKTPSQGIGNQLSLAEIAKTQPPVTAKQPSLSDLANTGKQLSDIQKQPSLADLASKSRQPNVKQVTNIKSLAEIANNQNSGKIVPSLSPKSKQEVDPSLSLLANKHLSSTENVIYVGTSERENLESNLSSLNIHEQKNVKISLADLAGKKSLKYCQKVTKAIVKEEKPFQTQILNDSLDREQMPEQIFIEEIGNSMECEILKLRASYVGQVLCLNQCKYNTSKDTRKRKYFKFSYIYQMKHVKKSADVVKKTIPFDFSTPSPDDIFKSRQKAAFTRTGEKK